MKKILNDAPKTLCVSIMVMKEGSVEIFKSNGLLGKSAGVQLRNVLMESGLPYAKKQSLGHEQLLHSYI